MKRIVVVVVAALVGFGSSAWADELRSTREQPLYEVAHSVEISVTDGVATYKVRRQFANPGKVADEVGLAIDLPSGGAATGLRIRAKDRWYDGVLMERDKAAALYHELTGMGAYEPKDPALLQWRWADKLYLQVFPVFPGQVSTVEYTLTVPTRYAGGRYWLSYPRTGTGTATEPGAHRLATPTITVKPAYGNALTAITVDGRRVASDTPVVLTPPVREPWQDLVVADEHASYATSTLAVAESSHTKKPITTAKLEVGITHTFQGDLRVELVTPQGKVVNVIDQLGAGKNNIDGTYTLALPAGTIGAGTWRLIVSDHARLDAGTLDRWQLTFGAGADVTVAAADDLPVFVPDAPEGDSDAGVAPIAIAPPAIQTWDARLGRVVASAKHAFGRLELDVAPQLSKLPVKAQIVFVVDTSFSVGAELLAAQLATIRAYLTHVPDAEVEIVTYRRRATRVFGSFVPAKTIDWGRITATAPAFALGNGSALDEAGKLAAAALATRSGPKRVVVMTDELLRTRLTADGAAGPLAALAKDTIVHVVLPHVDHDDRTSLERDDLHPLSRLATRHHGILAHVRGFPVKAEKDLPPLVLELVRPTRIEKLSISSFVLESPTLAEGAGLRLWSKDNTVPMRVVLTGTLWSDPIRKQVDARPGDPFSRATAAFVFGADEHQDLTPAEMMTVALAGRAVSPVTSYVAFEPGTRPSTIGIDDSNVYGGLLGHGSGEGGGGFGFGSRRSKPSIYVETEACVKQHKPAAGWRVGLSIETTRDEIVDIAIEHGDPTLASCLAETGWAIRLDGRFDLDRETFAIELHD